MSASTILILLIALQTFWSKPQTRSDTKGAVRGSPNKVTAIRPGVKGDYFSLFQSGGVTDPIHWSYASNMAETVFFVTLVYKQEETLTEGHTPALTACTDRLTKPDMHKQLMRAA